jgi:hypothetical protein
MNEGNHDDGEEYGVTSLAVYLYTVELNSE